MKKDVKLADLALDMIEALDTDIDVAEVEWEHPDHPDYVVQICVTHKDNLELLQAFTYGGSH